MEKSSCLVWIDGSVVNDYMLEEHEALELAEKFKEDGYENITIEETNQNLIIKNGRYLIIK